MRKVTKSPAIDQHSARSNVVQNERAQKTKVKNSKVKTTIGEKDPQKNDEKQVLGNNNSIKLSSKVKAVSSQSVTYVTNQVNSYKLETEKVSKKSQTTLNAKPSSNLKIPVLSKNLRLKKQTQARSLKPKNCETTKYAVPKKSPATSARVTNKSAMSNRSNPKTSSRSTRSIKEVGSASSRISSSRASCKGDASLRSNNSRNSGASKTVRKHRGQKVNKAANSAGRTPGRKGNCFPT